MSRTRSGRLLRSALALLLAPLLATAALAAGDPASVEECVRKNVPGASSVQTVSIRAQDEDGAVKEMKGTIWWMKDAGGLSRARVLVAEPLDMRGAGVLLLQQKDRTDLFVYLPELKKVRRVTGRMMSGALFGTDLTYEQLERIQGTARESAVKRLDDDALGGRPVYVLESSPAVAGESEFATVVSFIDKATCVPLKVEFLGEDGKARRVLVIDPSKIEKRGGGHVPLHVEVDDVEAGTKTVLVVEKIEIGATIPETVFSQAALETEGR